MPRIEFPRTSRSKLAVEQDEEGHEVRDQDHFRARFQEHGESLIGIIGFPDRAIKVDGVTMEKFIHEILSNVKRNQTSIEEAVCKLLSEMGRGSRVIIVDEHLFGLDNELAELNYTVGRVRSGAKDEQILPILDNRVFVTVNRKHFKDKVEEFNFGLIVVNSKYGDYQQLAQMVSKKLMETGFKRNLTKVVSV